jgi:hypothetical protein
LLAALRLWDVRLACCRLCPVPGGDWFRLRTLRQGKRAEEADVVS